MMENERLAFLDRLGGSTYAQIGASLGVSAIEANRLALAAADKLGTALDAEPPHLGDRWRAKIVEELGVSVPVAV